MHLSRAFTPWLKWAFDNCFFHHSLCPLCLDSYFEDKAEITGYGEGGLVTSVSQKTGALLTITWMPQDPVGCQARTVRMECSLELMLWPGWKALVIDSIMTGPLQIPKVTEPWRLLLEIAKMLASICLSSLGKKELLPPCWTQEWPTTSLALASAL